MVVLKTSYNETNGVPWQKASQARNSYDTDSEKQILDRTSTRNQLRDIWTKVLKKDAPFKFSDGDDFFEVGGDSLLAYDMIVAAKRRGILLDEEQIFMGATLKDLAEEATLVGSLRENKINHRPSPKAFGLLEEAGIVLQNTEKEISMSCNTTTESIETAYPCSPMQESLVTEFDGSKNLYLMQLVFKLADNISLDRFRQAWDDTIRANPVLRTRICRLDGTPRLVQAVLNESMHWNIVFIELARFLEEDANVSMQPGDPFFRYSIVTENEGELNRRRHFVWTVHHALCDAASMQEIIDEVARRFRDEATPHRQSFAAFIKSAIISSPLPEEQFWKNAFTGINPTPYPPPPHVPEFRADPTSTLELPLTLERHPPFGVTKALLLRAAWAILMSQYTGTEDVGFGVINNGRRPAVDGVSPTTGPTLNLVPIALHVDRRQSVASFLSQVRVQAAEMMAFEHSGISKIRTYLAGDSSSTAVDFQTLFVVQPMEFSDAIAPHLQKLGLENLSELGKKERHPYPLVATLTLSAGALITFKIQHDGRVFSTQQAQNLIHQFQAVVTQLSNATKETLLESISPLSDYDVGQIRLWNKTTPLTEDKCIQDLFQKQVLKQPDAVAVCSLERSLTYLDVDEQSSSLASRIIELNVGPGAFVGVCFEKSIWTVVAILAVFKAGCIYVPIDPTHPRGRLEEVVEMAQIRLVLASQSSTRILEGLFLQVILVDDNLLPSLVDSQTNFPKPFPPSTAYLLFTSGSTGKPKGILMSHSAICTSILNHGPEFGAGPHWRTLQFGSHTFDLSIGEFFTTLAFGGCVCVPSEHDRLNNLAGAITELKANTLLVVPTVAKLLNPEDVPTLKTMVLAGEPITKETIVRWADHVELTAAYGPSETAVWCSGNLRVSTDAHPANIGRSIGATMWIVSPENYHQLSAIGCVGEIVISGALLGEGYLSNKAITDAAFVPAPDWLRNFDSTSPFKMLYRSGDLARYNPDGTFHIVGRSDTQVKLRGFRIELGEIENQIMAKNTAKSALAALPRQGPCAGQIVAVLSYHQSTMGDHNESDVKISSGSSSTSEKIKQNLSLTLPEYMVPSVWIVVEKMPLLISGKIDRKLLKLWIENLSYENYETLIRSPDINGPAEISPGSLTDRLRRLWGEVLKVSPEIIKTNSSFFAFGGDSIAAIQVVSRAKEVGLVVTVRGIINTKTLRHLVTLVQQSQTAAQKAPRQLHDTESMATILLGYEDILKSRLNNKHAVRVEDAYPLSPIQREIMKARATNPAVFVLSLQMEFHSFTSNPISLDRLIRSWKRVVQKFTVLRSIFLQDPARELPAIQVVLANAEPEIRTSSAYSGDIEPSFATSGAPSVDECFLPHRAHFFKYGDIYFLHIDFDHLVIDGWSLKLIKTAFLEAYEIDAAYTWEETPSYKSFVAAHRPDRVETDNNHWALVLRGQRPSLLSLPVVSHEACHQPSPSKTIINLPDIKAQELKKFSVEHSVTPASIFDSAWAQTLSFYTHSSDVAFEYVVSGRDEEIPGVLDMVGPLINIVPYHLQGVSTKGGSLGLASLAQRMQDQRSQDSMHTASNVREVIENDVKLEMLFNTAVNFQRRPAAVETDKSRIDEPLQKILDPWHFDVLIRILYIIDDDTIRPSFEFDAQVFDQHQMKEVSEDFWRRVQSTVA